MTAQKKGTDRKGAEKVPVPLFSFAATEVSPLFVH